jgi:RNA polymerase sigma factor FliA
MSSYAIKPKEQLNETGSNAHPARTASKRNRPVRGHHDSNRTPSPRSRAAAQTFCERDALALKLRALVRRVALEMRDRLPQHVDLDDLAGAGNLGLLDAVQKFDARKHVKIETYARHRIRGAILDNLREMDTASRDMRRKNRTAEKVCRELQLKLGRAATDEEMAEALGMSLKRWHRTVQELNGTGADWMRPNQIPEATVVDENNLADDGGNNPFDLCYRSEQRDILGRAALLLSERERAVLSLYYEHEMTMKQIGDRMGIDESRVSQIHSAAVAHLRSKVRKVIQPAQRGLAPLSLVAAARQDPRASAA